MLKLDRRTLASLLQNNQQAIAAFERVLGDVGFTLPSTIEEANALAGQALSVAHVALAMLSQLGEALERIDMAPTALTMVDHDDTSPRAHLGTVSSQNADQVEITGGAVDGTTIGQTTAAAAKFTTVDASGQITSTVATGAAPLVIASTTKVPNLHVERATSADTAAEADKLTKPTNFPPAATDAASTQTLVNALRTAAIAKGL